jgi:hypothetical protein
LLFRRVADMSDEPNHVLAGLVWQEAIVKKVFREAFAPILKKDLLATLDVRGGFRYEIIGAIWLLLESPLINICV